MPEISQSEVSRYMSMLGKKSASKLSKTERTLRARKASEARWGKRDSTITNHGNKTKIKTTGRKEKKGSEAKNKS